MSTALTGAELLEEVRDAVARRADVSEARIFRALNMAQDRIFREPVHWPDTERHRETVSGIVLGQDTIPLTSLIGVGETVHEVYTLRYQESVNIWYRLKYIDPRMWDRYSTDFASAYPAYYTYWGDSISLYPRPDRNFDVQLRYAIVPWKITASTQEILFGTMSGILVAYAVSHILHSVGRAQEAAVPYRIARQQLENAMMNLRRVTDEQSPAFNESGYTGEYWNNPFVRVS